jgi:hypothetical protein
MTLVELQAAVAVLVEARQELSVLNAKFDYPNRGVIKLMTADIRVLRNKIALHTSCEACGLDEDMAYYVNHKQYLCIRCV